MHPPAKRIYLSGYYFICPLMNLIFFLVYTYIEYFIYELRYCKENIVHRHVSLPIYIFFFFKTFFPLGNKVIFYVFISFVSYLSSCTRIREVYNISDYGQSFPAKGSNYSCNSRLMWISVPILGTSYTFMFDRIYSQNGPLILVENKKSLN